MKTVFSISFAALMLLLSPAYGAVTVVESARVHTAAGANGCTVSGATNATPIVITCSAAHNLQDGDQIQITGVGGNTNANTTGYAKVTSYSTTTFGLYSDSGLSTGVAGNSGYTSGGAVSEATDISGFTSDWTLRLRVENLTSGKKVLVSIQDSADGFVSDIKTLAVFNLSGPVTNTYGAEVERTYRSFTLPSARFGVSNGRVRVYVQSIDSSGSVTTSLFIQ